MKKKNIVLAIAVLVVLVPAILGFATTGTQRWHAYSALDRLWLKSHADDLPEWVMPLFGPFEPVVMDVEPGLKMRLDPGDLISRTILIRGAWEPVSWTAMKEHLPPGGTFVDVGAHIGYYSLKAAAAMGKHSQVVSVEPNPATLKNLRENVRLSGAPVGVYPYACSDEEATLELFAAPKENSGMTSLAKANAGGEGGQVSYKVRARPLDEIVRESGVTRIDLLKIDVEGAEMLVLKGARETLERFKPVLIIEIVDHQLKAMGTSEAQLRAELARLGYHARHSFEQNVEFVR